MDSKTTLSVIPLPWKVKHCSSGYLFIFENLQMKIKEN